MKWKHKRKREIHLKRSCPSLSVTFLAARRFSIPNLCLNATIKNIIWRKNTSVALATSTSISFSTLRSMSMSTLGRSLTSAEYAAKVSASEENCLFIVATHTTNTMTTLNVTKWTLKGPILDNLSNLINQIVPRISTLSRIAKIRPQYLTLRTL